MPKSLESRLNGDGDKFIKDVEIYGSEEALRNWQGRLGGYHDYISLRNFLEKKTGNRNFGIRATLGGTGNSSLAEDLLDAFVNKIRQMEAQKQSLETELRQVKLELKYAKGQQSLKTSPKIMEVMALCQGET